MEVDATSFPHDLLGLLVNISEADFVSFDLELSGIPSRLPGKAPWKPRAGGRKTLEDRYEETKAAAERYQILQVGVTCARFDYLANKYVLQPYNIMLSPLLDERLDIEREVCIQSGAATFLLSNGFDLGAPFAKGVQYLSREEAARAKQMAYDRFDKKNVIEDIRLKAEDVDSIDFVRRAREAITQWKTSNAGTLEITTHTGLSEQPLVPVISRFEKRLVHQLVRAEFPDLVSMGRSECIRIIHLDPLREAENTKRLKNRVKEQIAKQTGFRWVFEALAQGDIHQADPFHFSSFASGFIIAADSHDVKDRFDRTQERLKKHQPVLVGHNMFTDIVYFYRSFVGELPDTLEEFCEAVHKLFPRIIDTKYLATHAEGDLNASPTLQEIAEKLENQSLPDIVTHADHSKYHEKQAFHEAGYDSLLTATIMLRLSAKLDAERRGEMPKAAETRSNTSCEKSFKSAKEDLETLIDGQEKVQEPVSLPPIENTPQVSQDEVPRKMKKKKKNKRNKAKDAKKASQRRFETGNMFDSLRLSTESEQESSSSEEDHTTNGVYSNAAEDNHHSASPTWQSGQFAPDTSSWVPIETIQRKPMELIPAFDSEFWNEFGNTLRIFGTQEAVLKIAAWKD